jgi:hypothetical protein
MATQSVAIVFCETDFVVSSAKGAGNDKIGFLKASLRLAFKKPIFIMRIAAHTLGDSYMC